MAVKRWNGTGWDIYAGSGTPLKATDGRIGTTMWVGATTPSSPTDGDVWIDNTANGLIDPSTFTTSGDLIVGTGSGTYAKLGLGTSGQALVSNGTTAVWGSVVPWTSSAQTSSFTAVARNQYFVNTSSAVTVTLPASPSLGDEIRIFDATGSAATNNITVTPGATLNLQGSNQTLLMNVNYGSATLIYTGSTYGWKVA